MVDIRLAYVKLGQSGRVVIPQDVRDQLKLEEGDDLLITVEKLPSKKEEVKA